MLRSTLIILHVKIHVRHLACVDPSGDPNVCDRALAPPSPTDVVDRARDSRHRLPHSQAFNCDEIQNSTDGVSTDCHAVIRMVVTIPPH
jgi:hypothetical protein